MKRKTNAARRGDWKTEPMPARRETFVLSRSFSEDEMAALRRGFVPQAMEDKWFWYMEGSTLWAHRSWSGFCIYRIDFREDGRHVVTVNRDPEQYGCTDIGEDTETLNKLLDWWTQTPCDSYHQWLSETYDALQNAEVQTFDYEAHFHRFREEQKLDLALSFDMPAGYETASGTFDAESGTVFLNAEQLKTAPDCEKAFYLFHELRHAAQALRPEQFSSAIRRSTQYVIQYDGTCFKLVDSRYYECRLEGSKDDFSRLYLGQPHELDANAFAYEQARKLCGDSEELRKLYAFWTPNAPVPDAVYDAVYAQIDEKIKGQIAYHG